MPEDAPVVLERRDLDAGAFERLGRLAAVEVRHGIPVGEDPRRDAQPPPEGRGAQSQRASSERPDRARDQRSGVQVEAQHEAGCVSRPREDVGGLAEALGLRVDQVEGAAVQIVGVGDVVHGARDEVDRHQVQRSALDPGQRQPRGKRRAELLEQLEEVVGAVDLVDLAGLRVTHDDARPVDAPRQVALGPHHRLGLVLAPGVGIAKPARLVEHVLAEQAGVAARDRDRARVVESTRPDRVGQLNGVNRPADVVRLQLLRARSHVVEGRQVEEVVDSTVERRGRRLVDAEERRTQVTDDRDDSIVVHSPAVAKLVEAREGALPDQRVDCPPAFQK
jgi:hypothetical protein